MVFTFSQDTIKMLQPSTPMFFRLIYCCILLLTLSCSHSASDKSTAAKKQPQPQSYQSSDSCKNCHSDIYNQFAESMHARSYSNPVFNKIYFNALMQRVQGDTTLVAEMNGCISCHSPMTFIEKGDQSFTVSQDNQNVRGVSCDFCHTIRGYQGAKPEGGNYIAAPGFQKLGPLQYKNDHHRAYSELITTSEYCATCHNRTNRYGLEIISTFSEWQKSRFAKEGIQCQDCHMNAQGFLTAGKPVYASGTAAQGTMIVPKQRKKLSSHRFPGAHSKSQVVGAIKLNLQIDESASVAGNTMMIFVDVDNSKSGHNLPTGSAELRLLYLELTAKIQGKTIHIPANSLDRDMLDVAGKGEFDTTILGKDIPGGSRLYRAVCVDPEGQQTLFSFDAERIIFDNRLKADEIRREFFTFNIPDIPGLKILLNASLTYLRYPSALADSLGIDKAEPVQLAVVQKEIAIQAR